MGHSSTRMLHPINLRSYITTKTGYTLEQFNSIDWDNLGKTIQAQPLPGRVRLTKFMHDWLP
eukprot:13270050-Ditylum_brightwellii.AAC.1